ncbi:MAG: 5'/3'-nucleotidase SurE [Bacteroidales bacterium]|nr:5'/3'-nucleotidase SurE [Bacteroidales bacterium]
MNKKPLILITNDDGYFSNGITKLAEIMHRLGNVIIVAPETEMSGQSHSITVTRSIKFRKIENECYAVDGTPVDCVKIAINKILKQRPNLIVAGINHGCNASINTIYSGTMSAVFEGCAENIPSIGFSMNSHLHDVSLDYTDKYIYSITQDVIKNGLKPLTCLNVNFPVGKIKGIKVCHQAKAFWKENFIPETNENGEISFWLNGQYNLLDMSDRADFRALTDGYVSITPMQVDFTAYNVLEEYSKRFDQC